MENMEKIAPYVIIILGSIYLFIKHYKKTQNKVREKFGSVAATGSYISSLIWMGLLIFALYVSYKCNNGFDPVGALAAYCCPIFYIPYKLLIDKCEIFS